MRVRREPAVRLEGQAVSAGIATGRLFRIDIAGIRAYPVEITRKEIPRELDRLRRALERARNQLRQIKRKLEAEVGGHQARIIDAHLLMLEDRAFTVEVRHLIRSESISAERAIKSSTDRMLVACSAIRDPYLRERGMDILDVAGRLLGALSGNGRPPAYGLPKDTILLADELPATVVAELDYRRVRGFATRTGGWTSHASILARSLEIPALSGLDVLHPALRTTAPAILNADEGWLLVNPDPHQLRQFQSGRILSKSDPKRSNRHSPPRCVTRDGAEITLRANILLPEEAEGILHAGAQGIGLFRSEYLSRQSRVTLPDELAQLQIYRRLIKAAGPFGAAIRVFDLIPPSSVEQTGIIPRSDLGSRALRSLLEHEEIYRTQLRALMRAAIDGPLRVLLPFVSGIEELREFRRLMTETGQALAREGIHHASALPLGVMIEVPAAVLMVDLLASEANFLSLGTNDLIAYLLAVDRDTARAGQSHSALHPAVLRAIAQVISTAGRRDIPVEVCGEMAGNPLQSILLIGLGATTLSLAPSRLPLIRSAIRSVDLSVVREMAGRAVASESVTEVERLLQSVWPPPAAVPKAQVRHQG